MQGVLEGFTTIGLVIALGYVLAQLGVLREDAQLALANIAFFVASPALMVTVLSEADVSEVFSKSLIASAGAIAVTGVVYVACAVLVWRKPVGELVVGLLSSVYVNAGNLGIPIASYVLGDAAFVAPILLLQLLIMQPLSLGVLDNVVAGRGFSVTRALGSALTNPLTLGSLLGLALALTHRQLPGAIHDPLALVAGIAVPGMLIAYGISLSLGPRPVTGVGAAEIGVITALKLVAQPLAAYLIARWALGLESHIVYAVTVLAALPTAQNIFVTATRYQRGVVLARDSIFVTTMLSVPAILAISALLA